ncbi:MAG: M55 family metallopeptidase [Firmicutes bacterium]|nr:M55 family metallopeptidase [Bacillota bacterium]
MKFMVAVDLEGVACVVGSPNKTLTDSPDFEFARKQATKEADAAARALFAAGAQQVIVWDNHGSSLNLLYDQLDRRCDLVVGVDALHRWPGLDESFSGVLMIGYHPMDNTVDGVLAHTFSSVAYQYIKINGVEVGEIAIDGAMAGERGVPLIFVASCDKGVTEAKKFMPWVETVTTKKGLGRNLALSMHPDRAAEAIYSGVERAVKGLAAMEPFTFAQPMTMQIRHKRLEGAQQLARSQTGWRLLDPYTTEKDLAKLSDYF